MCFLARIEEFGSAKLTRQRDGWRVEIIDRQELFHCLLQNLDSILRTWKQMDLTFRVRLPRYALGKKRQPTLGGMPLTSFVRS
jgi:hypothetical protein